MTARVFPAILLFLLSEPYLFFNFRSAIKKLPSFPKALILFAYITITVLAWVDVLYFFRIYRIAFLSHAFKNFLSAFFIGFYLAKATIITFLLVEDGWRLVRWLQGFSKRKSPAVQMQRINTIPRSEFLKRTAWAIGGATLGLFLYGFKDRYTYIVNNVAIKLPKLPESFKGIRIVHLSDIHTGSFDSPSDVERGIDLALAQNPDIIFFTGDLVNNLASEIDAEYKRIFSKLKAPMGVYSIFGNHDYGDYIPWKTKMEKQENIEQLKAIHAAMGWKLLLNENIILEKNNQCIALLGMENWSAKPHYFIYGDMQKTYEGLENSDIPVKILLTHDPSHWDAQVCKKYQDIDLTLSGHTHGMQFGIDNKIFKWSPVQYSYKNWAGLYQQEHQYLYVNRGFGFIGYPGRIGVMPEITVIELV
jgi:uncharacterized protein